MSTTNSKPSKAQVMEALHWFSPLYASTSPISRQHFDNLRAFIESAPDASPAEVKHRQGCDALGGYGHGVGPCTCGAIPDASPDGQQRQDHVGGSAGETA